MSEQLPLKAEGRRGRDSNMELLRLTAMLLVVILHTNARGLPEPDAARIASHTVSAVTQFIVEGLSIIAVDTFVLLSGWYGIRPKAGRLAELLFQLLFFGVAGMALHEALAPGTLHEEPHIWRSLLLLSPSPYWFVKAYLGLYIVSPVLNAFVAGATKRQMAVLLAGFFAFETVMGWMWPGVRWFENGFSLTSFVGLYLLARYVRLHPARCWQLNKWCDLGIYLLASATLAALMLMCRLRGIDTGRLHAYNCPLIIVSALHFMLFFSKIRFSNAFVNWLGASALAIYLTHSGAFLWKLYDGAIVDWFYNTGTSTFVLRAGALVMVVFWGSIALDKVRIGIWKLLLRGWRRVAGRQ